MAIERASATAIKRGISAVLRQSMREANPIYTKFCDVRKSTGRDEEYALVGSVPGMRKWLGERDFAELTSAGFVITNEDFESSFAINRFDFDDDRIGIYDGLIAEHGDECAYHPDELLFEAINLGESKECWDGQFFYDTDHEWRDSGVQSNDLTHPAASGTTPTTSEFKAAYNAAVLQMLGFKKDNGKFWIRPKANSGTKIAIDNLVCRVPPALFEVATAAFEQVTRIELDGSNFAGTSNIVISKPEVVAIQYMGDGYENGSDAKFDVDYLGGRLKPFIFQLRKPLDQQVKGLEDIEGKWAKFMAEARYAVGYGAWAYSVRTTFT